jgi:hypothetical protein
MLRIKHRAVHMLGKYSTTLPLSDIPSPRYFCINIADDGIQNRRNSKVNDARRLFWAILL